MRTIGIDCRFASALGGLGTFTRAITSALLSADIVDHFVLFVVSEKEEWLQELSKRPNVSVRTVKCRPYSLSEQIQFPLLLSRSGLDLLYVPHFNVPLFCPVPFVCTVHDLILHHYPNQASLMKRIAYRIVIAFAIRRARRIVAVSNATRNDVLKRYHIRPEKIVTVYPGISKDFGSATDASKKEAMQRFSVSRPFFLYVGNCKEHKNVQTLIDAFVASNLTTHEVLLASSGSECARLVLHSNVRFIGPVDERLLPSLYSLAVAFVTATKLEGFCLPVLEAMACGCPVFASNVGPIPEVAGGHALLVNPGVVDVANAMSRMASDRRPSPEHIAAAKDWASRFTWQKSAEKLRQILQAL